ncbi:MAG TPA: hypothetical protein VJ302_06675, partial [Blastocatellia bacterium]|nr:hypothetical protein [Blastocatellia bacterium]
RIFSPGITCLFSRNYVSAGRGYPAPEGSDQPLFGPPANVDGLSGGNPAFPKPDPDQFFLSIPETVLPQVSPAIT